MFPIETVLDGVRRDLAARKGSAIAPPSGYPGYSGGGMDVLGLVTGLVGSIKAARHASAEQDARRNAQAELAAFCREHDCSVLEEGPSAVDGVRFPSTARQDVSP